MLASIEKLAGDSLLTLDMRHRRMSLFTPAGEHVRDIPLQGATPFIFLTLVGPLGDGTYLTSAPGGRMGPELLSRPLGPARDSLQLFRVDSAGATIDTVGVFPAMRVNVKSIEIAGRAMPMGIPVAFSSATHVATGDGVAYIGVSDTYEIGSVFDAGGRLLGTVAMPADLVVSEIGADYVIGHQTDDLEIQRVLVYQLLKPAR